MSATLSFPRHASLYAHTLLFLLLVAGSWMANGTFAAVAAQASIPQESIRLRILANSDTYGDQWIKGKVRDAVVREIDGWVAGPVTLGQARAAIRAHLPELQAVVGETLRQYGYDYGYAAELGVVPFPTKLYGDRVYPAGDYEALLITLGEGQGHNWWCVLFPPLCFINASSGDAVATPAVGAGAVRALAEKGADKLSGGDREGREPALIPGAAAHRPPAGNPLAAAGGQAQPEVRFFLWDLIEKIVHFLKSLFS